MEKECPKCETKFHTDTKRKFCSRKCANSRGPRSQETKDKISLSIKNYIVRNGSTVQNMTKEKFDLAIEKSNQTRLSNFMSKPFGDIAEASIRKRVVLEQNRSCNRCGLSEWQNEPIILELEHKDGNNRNNERVNLECLCPNCHSLTSTWRGRNKRKSSRDKKVSDVEVCRAFLEKGNIRQTLLSLGLAAKGSNYGRVKRCLTQHGILYTK